jgi:hypothetical protein
MKKFKLYNCLIFLILSSGCAPFDKIYSHEFADGYFKLKTEGLEKEPVYLRITSDSIGVYPVLNKGRNMSPDNGKVQRIEINNLKPGDYLNNSTFIKTSLDVDLSTAILKYRPAAANVPNQLSANVNGLFYAGFRKDFFKLKSHSSQLNELKTLIRHTGYDFGLFAGIGITPVNPTVTNYTIIQEYDGMIFQKGVSAFITFENMSVGFALGFDNLLDKNKSSWIYNQKPWLGLILGIANF